MTALHTVPTETTDDDLEIKWVKRVPPIKRAGRKPSKWASVASRLEDRPGSWALVAEGKQCDGLGHAIKKGGYRCFQPAGSFEATQRGVGDRAVLYARFVGKPPAKAPLATLAALGDSVNILALHDEPGTPRYVRTGAPHEWLDVRTGGRPHPGVLEGMLRSGSVIPFKAVR